jgi:hypothetical protein
MVGVRWESHPSLPVSLRRIGDSNFRELQPAIVLSMPGASLSASVERLSAMVPPLLHLLCELATVAALSFIRPPCTMFQALRSKKSPPLAILVTVGVNAALLLFPFSGAFLIGASQARRAFGSRRLRIAPPASRSRSKPTSSRRPFHLLKQIEHREVRQLRSGHIAELNARGSQVELRMPSGARPRLRAWRTFSAERRSDRRPRRPYPGKTVEPINLAVVSQGAQLCGA